MALTAEQSAAFPEGEQFFYMQTLYAVSMNGGTCTQLANGAITREQYIASLVASGVHPLVAEASIQYCMENWRTYATGQDTTVSSGTQTQSSVVQNPSWVESQVDIPSEPIANQTEIQITQDESGYWRPTAESLESRQFKELEWVESQNVLPPEMPPVDEPKTETPIPETPTSTPIPTNQTPVDATIPEEIQYVRTTLDAVSELMREIELACIEDCRRCITEAIPPITTSESICLGRLQTSLDSCEQILGRCSSKALRPIQQGLGQCYGYLSQCGCCYPNPEQVVYGLQTGNYLESVGLTPACVTIQNQTNIVNQGDSSYESSSSVVSPIIPSSESQGGTTTPEITEPSQASETSTYTREELETLIATTLIGLTGAPAKPEEFPTTPRPPTRDAANPSSNWRTPLWDDKKVCADIESDIRTTPDREMFGFYKRPEGNYHPQWFGDAFGIHSKDDYKNASWLRQKGYDVLWGLFHGLSDMSEPILQKIAQIASCDRLAVDSIFIKIFTGFVSHWTNGSLDGLFKGMEYKLNQSCPQQIPSQGELNAMRLGDLIDFPYWKCLTEANNNLPILQNHVVYSQRTKITFDDALKLYRLERINNEQFHKWAWANGVITAADLDALEKAKIDIPTVSDLIRMMVRDVGDPDAIKKYGLEDEFDKKWKGSLKTFGDAQGIDPEIAKLHWAAHWDQPSNTQVFEMLHRLRPNSPEANALDAQSKANGGKGVITTEQDVKDLLAINDMLPYWRDRFVAISYRPLTRIDAQRAFDLGALGATPQENETKLKGVYQDLGYNEQNAQILVDFTKKKSEEAKRRKALPKSVNKAIKYYLDGIHTIDQLQDYLNFLRIPLDRQPEILKLAKDERKMILYKNAIDCIRRSYMLGALDDVQAKAALVNEGMAGELAIENVSNWWCKKKGKAKEITAAKLCEWRELRLIDEEQHLRRLVNLGYKLEDAENIVRECIGNINERAMKRLKAELSKQQAQVEKAQNEMERNEKRAANAAKKAAKN